MTSLVLDGSIALAWLLPDESGAGKLLDSVAEDGAEVPGIWPLEVANALIVAERRGRITGAQRAKAIEVLGALPIAIDEETAARAWTDILTIGVAQRLTIYDAAYLELARRRSLPLATLDKDLAKAGRALGIPILVR